MFYSVRLKATSQSQYFLNCDATGNIKKKLIKGDNKCENNARVTPL